MSCIYINKQFNTIILKMVVFLGCILFFSCKNSKDIPVVDLNRMDRPISLNINDILKDVSIVQISNDIISINDKIYVTPQYFIIYRNKYSKTSASLDLFNRKGERVRNLAVRGNGPGEFNIIENFFVDEDERILYYTDKKSRTLLHRVDIRTAEKLDPLQMDFNYLTMNYINGKVYSFPNVKGYFQSNEYPDSAIIFRSTSIPSGEVKKYKGEHSYPFILLGSSITFYNEDIFLINQGYSDTLFNLTDNILKPLCVFNFPNKLKDYTKGGSLINLISAYKNGIVLSKMNIEFHPPMTVIYKPEYYALYDRNGMIRKIDNIQVKSAEIDLADPQKYAYMPLPVVCGKYGYMFVEKDALGDLSDLDADNDNPVIIVGKLR